MSDYEYTFSCILVKNVSKTSNFQTLVTLFQSSKFLQIWTLRLQSLGSILTWSWRIDCNLKFWELIDSEYSLCKGLKLFFSFHESSAFSVLHDSDIWFSVFILLTNSCRNTQLTAFQFDLDENLLVFDCILEMEITSSFRPLSIWEWLCLCEYRMESITLQYVIYFCNTTISKFPRDEFPLRHEFFSTRVAGSTSVLTWIGSQILSRR